jgi:hypothetical protein
VDPALGCTPWTAPDLTDPGHKVPALALNELQAGAFQLPPQALIPAGDPFAQNPPYSGTPSLNQVNAYRRGVDQPEAKDLPDASTTTYCRNLVNRGLPLLQLERDPEAEPGFEEADSPAPAVAPNLFEFMMLRFFATYMLLNEDGKNCADLLHKTNPVKLNAAGTVIEQLF